MDISITTPGLLFPAISLLMLSHTNRFLALANLIRSLLEKYKNTEDKAHIKLQIQHLRSRLHLIRTMQVFGVLSFLLCAICMCCIFMTWMAAATVIFVLSIFTFIISLLVSLTEIVQSLNALEVEMKNAVRD
ncbi:MAG: DUF2721 domain-containing protein [Flavipsychrobacter sp.]|nr:DUF2721 domain-containing protein [Flavipsychrobacter sp.]